MPFKLALDFFTWVLFYLLTINIANYRMSLYLLRLSDTKGCQFQKHYNHTQVSLLLELLIAVKSIIGANKIWKSKNFCGGVKTPPQDPPYQALVFKVCISSAKSVSGPQIKHLGMTISPHCRALFRTIKQLVLISI